MNGRAHISGVGGVGMSALAELLLALGHEVSGSDRSLDQGHSLEHVTRLKRSGLQLHPQDGSALDGSVAMLAVSTAIEGDNPEIAAAQRLGVEIVHRAEVIARLAANRRVIAIAGTAGKTTTTALTGWLLEQAGLDPTVVNGGTVLNWTDADRPGNVRAGRGPIWVVEVDESDRSLLRFHPEAAAILNMSKDHFELDEVIQLFGLFASQVRGTLLGGPGVREVLGPRVTSVLPDVRREGQGWTFDLAAHRFSVPLIGRHNAENACMAVHLCMAAGADPARLAEALPRFRGVGRRLELVGTRGGVRVIDDYAHNPAKMAASWRAVQEDGSRVLGIWRPHGFGPLKLMKDELRAALKSVMRPGDRLHVLPVFYAGGTANRTVSSDAWVGELQADGIDAVLVNDYAGLEARLLAAVRPGDAILGMGARDPELPSFARRLVTLLPGG